MTTIAMLDRATEDVLFSRFAEYFRVGEQERRWNLWEDVPWDQVNPRADDALTEAVLAAYVDELFLPDRAAQILHRLRSSRGRAWFIARWTYEEGKHLLALSEWLLQSGKRSDEELKEFSDRVLSETTWEPILDDPTTTMVQTLAHELGEIERYRKLEQDAQAQNDGALAAVCRRLLSDEEAHRAFFREALLLIREREPDLVEQAVRRVAAAPETERFGPALREELRI